VKVVDSQEKRSNAQRPDPSAKSQNRLADVTASIFGFCIVSLVVIIASFYFRWFWLLFLSGLGLTIKYWKHRQSGDAKNAVCFFGILASLTGVIGIVICYLLSK
jgi:hypothetical protein